MRKLANNKETFVVLSVVSGISLIGAFGYPLQQLEVFKQTTEGAFGRTYDRVFVVTANDQNYPYGFDESRAVKVSQIFVDYSMQKWISLLICLASSSTALAMAKTLLPALEIDEQVQEIQGEAEKEFTTRDIKHKWALADKAQRMQYAQEMREMINQFDVVVEQEILDADDAAQDKFVNASYLEMEGHPIDVVVQQTWGYEKGTPEHKEMKAKFLAWKNDEDTESAVATLEPDVDFRVIFPEQMDSTTWKAVLSALQGGSTKETIVRDVLGCSESTKAQGEAYLKHLKEKFGI